MYYAYVLKSKKTGNFYYGSTDDLKRRLAEHNSGKGGAYTRKNMPLELVYYEAFLDYKDAKASERFFKTGYGREVIRGKLSNYLKSLK